MGYSQIAENKNGRNNIDKRFMRQTKKKIKIEKK